MLSYLTFTWAYGRKTQSALLDTAQQLPTVALLSGTVTLGGHLWHLGLPIFFSFAVLVAVSRWSHCGCHVRCWLLVSLRDKKGERAYFVQFQGIRPLHGEGVVPGGSWSRGVHTQEVESKGF